EYASSGLAMALSWTPLAILEREMDKGDEPTPAELEEILQRIRGLRYEIKPILTEATKKILRTLAHRLGGRPRKPNSDEYPAVCQEVADLYAKRVSLQSAFKRVGKRHNASARTIERIWRKRPKEL